MPRTRFLLLTLLSAALACGLSPMARADSSLVLPLPDKFGNIDAGTYDEEGQRVGPARLRLLKLEDGSVRLEATSRIDGSAEMRASADLALTEDGQGLRLVRQVSESKDEEGKPLGRLLVDHVRRVGVCSPPGGGAAQRIALPTPDRVVNVPHNLLFQSLARGESQTLDFQLLICRSGARLIDARATVVDDAKGLIEVRYDMQLGPILSRLAAPFLPRLSVWFDPAVQGGWVGQRFPLFAQGPTVIIVRTGVDPEALGAAH